MDMNIQALVPSILGRPYKYIKLDWSEEFCTLKMRTCVKPIQCYSLAGLSEIQSVLNGMAAHPGLVRHFVFTSDVNGVFNFGGDLSLFLLLVRAQDIESLRMYGRRCVELIWWMENAANLGIHTTVLVQGDTLGGGLESVLPFHKVVFERSAQGGFPEVLFNLFPGMGAWNYTIRKSGFAIASEMILSGRLYTADELYRRRMVDVVAEDGAGEIAVEQLVRQIDPRLRGTLAALQAQRVAAPITKESLIQIVDQWAESALMLTNRDLRLMERLARAQLRKVGGGHDGDGSVEELKRTELDTAWGEERSGISAWDPLSSGVSAWTSLA